MRGFLAHSWVGGAAVRAVAVALAVASVGLAATMPLLSPRPLGGVALVLGIAAVAMSIFHAAGRWATGARLAAGTLYLVQVAAFVLAGPHGPRFEHNQGAVSLLLVMLASTALLHRWADGFNGWARDARAWLGEHRRAEGLALSALTVLIILGGAEFLSAAIARTRLLPFDLPLTTYYRGKPVADWRPFHITADRSRVPDPYLLWKPAPTAPYNSKGFKGPEFAAAKPAGIFRIITLGDSNTDGPDHGGWPEELQRLLAIRGGAGVRFETINAGVVGYSSLQGLRRLEECLPYRPDLVTVSFGANDAHLVASGPDKSFAPRGPLSAQILRALFRYKAFLLARFLASRLRPSAGGAEAPLQPRVSLEDYEANLERMVALARAGGARVALLMRPYDPASALRAPAGNWIERAPAYNEATARVGRRLGVPVFDAYRPFEAAGPDTFIDDSHFTLLGHARMAKLLLDFLIGNGLVP